MLPAKTDNNEAAGALCHYLSSWPVALLSPWVFCLSYIHLQVSSIVLGLQALQGWNSLYCKVFLFICFLV